VLHGRGAPPIYDGFGPPVDPYRWESPPPELRSGNQPPLSGESTFPVLNGQVAGGSVVTGDNQAASFFVAGTFKAPAGTKTVTCTVAPVANPPSAPPGVEIRGNVYQIGCVAQPGGAPVSVASSYHLTLRFPPGPFREIQCNSGNGWRALPTRSSSGGQPYASVTTSGFGEFAATAPADSIFTILGRYAEFYGILAFVIIFGVIAIVQEIRRRRR
jgi:hypothetical protein